MESFYAGTATIVEVPQPHLLEPGRYSIPVALDCQVGRAEAASLALTVPVAELAVRITPQERAPRAPDLPRWTEGAGWRPRTPLGGVLGPLVLGSVVGAVVPAVLPRRNIGRRGRWVTGRVGVVDADVGRGARLAGAPTPWSAPTLAAFAGSLRTTVGPRERRQFPPAKAQTLNKVYASPPPAAASCLNVLPVGISDKTDI